MLGVIIAMLIVLACAVQPSAALASDDDRVELGIKPVGVDGSYFELTMSPGESRQLTVSFGNYGTKEAVASTYPADVYSLVNGGMGVRLAGEPTGPATDWLSFDAETIRLAAGEAALRTFAVSVPETTGPGEYITSVVVEDATPAEASSAGGVVATRVNRQAIAVAVTVPGPTTAALALGEAKHHVAGGRSVITVEVVNSGNVRLQPGGELVVTAASGGETARFPVSMGSVYAGATTMAEIPFTTLLEPGDYTVVLTLADASRGVTATTPELALTVPVSDAPDSAPVSRIAQSAALIQPMTASDEAGALPLVVIAGGVLALAAVVIVITVHLRKQTVAAPATATPSTTTTRPARPVTIRQLDVPRRPQVSAAPLEPARPRQPRFRPVTATGCVATITDSTTVKGA